MKKLCFLLLLVWAGTAYAQAPNAFIHGRLAQMKPGTWIYSQWYDTEHMALGLDHFDSVQCTTEGFTIPLHVADGGGNERVLFIGRKSGPGKGMLLYADKGKVVLTGKDSTFDNIEISGSSFAQDLNAFHHYLTAHAADAGADKKALSLQWIDAHRNSPICVYIIHNVYEPLYNKLTPDEQEAILNKLSPAATHNKVADALRYTIRTQRLTGIGRTAPDFTQNDTAGKPVSLQSFRGKYVLLDFWASWCAPCRRENPNVVKAFNQYKDKGFTVLGVSLDQAGKKEAWLKAIHDDGLTWTHVSDLQYWNSAAAKLYDVKAVPANFLLGPDGAILAKNLRGEALDKTLDSLLGGGKPFTFSGTVQGMDTGHIYLVATDVYEHKLVDTATVHNGRFTFTGSLPHPLMAFLSAGVSAKGTDGPNSVSFILDPGTTTAALSYGHFKNIQLTGAATQQVLDSLAKEKAAKKATGATAADLAAIDLGYIQTHPDAFASVLLLRSQLQGFPLEQQLQYLHALSPEIQQSGFGRQLQASIDTQQRGVPGTKAIGFTTTDINGNTLRLSDFRGRYVLLDFWASWCVPCRKGNPHLLELYGKYKSKGLEIIGVSDDDTRQDAWHKAVEKDRIGVWRHVLRGIDMEKVKAGDMNFSHHQREISNSKYGVVALPTKVLIDPQGNIIGRYGGSEADEAALDKKLGEALR